MLHSKGAGLTHKHQRMEKFARDKHSSFLRCADLFQSSLMFVSKTKAYPRVKHNSDALI
jgi:hypothetical protein